MIENEYIPITETPYVSKLAKDYLLGKDIGINNPLVTDYEGILELAKVRNFSETSRNTLVKALLNQYDQDGIPLGKNSKVYQNIISFKESNTFSFTTGQQIHIFLGPLFFIYKIQSLLRHVKNFNALSNTIKAVPVFWMASEDHDLEEINFVKLYGEKYTWEAESGDAVGRIRCEGLPELIDRLENRADKTEENKKLYSLFRKYYTNDKALAAASRGLLNEIFGEEGLVIIDPDDKILKKSFSGIAKKEIEEKILFNSYNEQNRLLKRHGFEPRVKAQEINFFWLENSKRIKLKVKNEKIVKGDSEEELSIDQILTKIENLSPNVITRPLYQETILPNLLYLGGAAEVEYWLSLQDAFKMLGLKYPALIQRDSVMQLSIKNIDFIEKIGFDWKQLFKKESDLVDDYQKISNTNSFVLKEKVNIIQANVKHLGDQFTLNEIKSGLVFKELHELQKGITRLTKLLSEEELKRSMENPVLKKLFKLKERSFNTRQEREIYLVADPDKLTLALSSYVKCSSFLIKKIL
jgi:bacillithiol biosynthesis cysteine-adding enzyme BshC